MKTYLFAWNPKKWNWSTLEQTISEIEEVGRAYQKWSVISHKKIRFGDRAFLMRLGLEPKGIMGAGFIASDAFLSPHWDGSGRKVNRVLIDFEVLLNPEKEPLLSNNYLENGLLGNYNWTPQSSGVEINSEYIDELEKVWFNFLNNNKSRNPLLENTFRHQEVYLEGAVNQITTTIYERNPHARKVCIDYYGLSCIVCNFNFEKQYGVLGRSYIHVHHLKKVADIRQEYAVNPIKDLRPVCPNCHAMIHKKKIPLTIEELKAVLNK